MARPISLEDYKASIRALGITGNLTQAKYILLEMVTVFNQGPRSVQRLGILAGLLDVVRRIERTQEAED